MFMLLLGAFSALLHVVATLSFVGGAQSTFTDGSGANSSNAVLSFVDLAQSTPADSSGANSTNESSCAQHSTVLVHLQFPAGDQNVTMPSATQMEAALEDCCAWYYFTDAMRLQLKHEFPSIPWEDEKEKRLCNASLAGEPVFRANQTINGTRDVFVPVSSIRFSEWSTEITPIRSCRPTAPVQNSSYMASTSSGLFCTISNHTAPHVTWHTMPYPDMVNMLGTNAAVLAFTTRYIPRPPSLLLAPPIQCCEILAISPGTRVHTSAHDACSQNVTNQNILGIFVALLKSIKGQLGSIYTKAIGLIAVLSILCCCQCCGTFSSIRSKLCHSGKGPDVNSTEPREETGETLQPRYAADTLSLNTSTSMFGVGGYGLPQSTAPSECVVSGKRVIVPLELFYDANSRVGKGMPVCLRLDRHLEELVHPDLGLLNPQQLVRIQDEHLTNGSASAMCLLHRVLKAEKKLKKLVRVVRRNRTTFNTDSLDDLSLASWDSVSMCSDFPRPRAQFNDEGESTDKLPRSGSGASISVVIGNPGFDQEKDSGAAESPSPLQDTYSAEVHDIFRHVLAEVDYLLEEDHISIAQYLFVDGLRHIRPNDSNDPWKALLAIAHRLNRVHDLVTYYQSS